MSTPSAPHSDMVQARDRFWLWGQTPDAHYGPDNPYKLPGHSRMTAMEGCVYFDLPNCCRIKMYGHPVAPYDQEALALDTLDRVVWSILGAGGEEVTEWCDLDDVIDVARKFPNIVGGCFDDFFSAKRMDVFTPERLREVKRRLTEGAGREMSTWCVLYGHQLDLPNLQAYLAAFDYVSFWTWYGDKYVDLAENLEHIYELAPGKKIMGGFYLWDYGRSMPLNESALEIQGNTYLNAMRNGRMNGIIFCSNCVADIDNPASPWVRRWIQKNGSVLVP